MGCRVVRVTPFKTKTVCDNNGGGSDMSDLSRIKSIYNQLGLSDTAINQLYNQYAPQKLTNPEEWGKSREAVDLIYNNAISPELSRWANAELNYQKAQELKAQDLQNRMLAGQQASTWSRLASTYGLSGGAAERMAENLARQSMLSNQDIASQYQMARLNTVAQDMANKQKMLMASPQLYNQLGQLKQSTDRFNIANNTAWNTQRLGNILNARQSMGQMWGDWQTANQAQAIANREAQRQRRANTWSGLGTALGIGAGALLGGPVGASIGGALGGGVSKFLGGLFG